MPKSLARTGRSFNWRWFIKTACIIVAIGAGGYYALLSPFLGQPIYNMVIFHPVKYPVGNYAIGNLSGICRQDLTFTSKNGSRLHGWFFEVPNSRFTVLLSHGNGGNLTFSGDSIELFIKHKLSVLAYDYQGYGKSEGSPSLANVVADARAAYDYLVDVKKVNPKKLILFGESLGTSIAGNLASKVQSAAVILQCPIASVTRRGREICSIAQIYPDFMWVEGGFDNISIFKKAHPPLFIISGTKDIMVPVAHADDLAEAACPPKMYARVEGAGHTHDPRLMNSKLHLDMLTAFLKTLP